MVKTASQKRRSPTSRTGGGRFHDSKLSQPGISLQVLKPKS